jgi:hypothetical protein
MKKQTKQPKQTDLTMLPVNRLYRIPWSVGEEFKIWAIQNGSSASKEITKLMMEKIKGGENAKD